MGTDEAMESELGLGELAGLTVANEADSLAYDVSCSEMDFKSLETFSPGKTICLTLRQTPPHTHTDTRTPSSNTQQMCKGT